MTTRLGETVMNLAIAPPFPPMEALLTRSLPTDDGWLFEPKWDGFRCLAFRDGDEIYLQSKSGRPLGRYFPDLVDALRDVPRKRYVLDGEIVIPVDGQLSFDELQLRLHPAESRVRMLAEAHPAVFIVFDLLVTERNTLLIEKPLRERRKRLERFAERAFDGEAVRLSPVSDDVDAAREWLDEGGGGIDGVMAKRVDSEYRSGERDAMMKVKTSRTADCVVAGFRYGRSGGVIGSLLLGMYEDDTLHHVGHTTGPSAAERRKLTPKLEALAKKRVKEKGFSGRSPGGPSRWATERSGEWEALPPELVVEVSYDHFTGGRFRHGTKFVRWRPDKAPRQCTFNQLPQAEISSLSLI